MAVIRDDRGFNQIFEQSKANLLRLKRRASLMTREMNASDEKEILEIGCGTGYISSCLANMTKMQVTGTDLCEPFIEEARKNYSSQNLTFFVLDFNKAAGLQHHKFDYVVGNGILHHLYYNLDQVLVTLKNLLNNQGKLIFMEPNVYNPYVAAIFKNTRLRKWANLEPDEMAFSKSFIQKNLELAGFENIKVEYKDFLLPGTPIWLVKPVTAVGGILEKTPIKYISQSILIVAENIAPINDNQL